MDKKCTKFESLFTFRSEDELLEHIKTCPECAQEYENMKKVSALIQEVKPYYQKKQSVSARIKAACVIMFLFLSGLTLGVVSLNTDVTDTLKYGTTLSSEDLGFPVDDYGLIAVE